MKIISEIDSLRDFEAWSGGKTWKEDFINRGIEDEVWETIEEMFPDGATETEVNDFLWFEAPDMFPEEDEEEDEEEADDTEADDEDIITSGDVNDRNTYNSITKTKTTMPQFKQLKKVFTSSDEMDKIAEELLKVANDLINEED